jgi:hypothetical protein
LKGRRKEGTSRYDVSRFSNKKQRAFLLQTDSIIVPTLFTEETSATVCD